MKNRDKSNLNCFTIMLHFELRSSWCENSKRNIFLSAVVKLLADVNNCSYLNTTTGDIPTAVTLSPPYVLSRPSHEKQSRRSRFVLALYGFMFKTLCVRVIIGSIFRNKNHMVLLYAASAVWVQACLFYFIIQWHHGSNQGSWLFDSSFLIDNSLNWLDICTSSLDC